MIETNRNLVIVMSLSGTIISIFWFIVFKFYFLEFKAKWLRNLFLMAIPFFLFPIPLLRNLFYRLFLVIGVLPASQKVEIEGDIDKTFMIVSQENTLIFSLWEMLLLIIISLTALISFACVTQQVCKYLKLRHAIRTNDCLPLTQWEIDELAETKRQMRVKKNVRLIKSSKASGPFTIGILRPIIVIPEELPATDHALRIVLGHELAHIKHRDVLFNLIACVIISMHWFNLWCYVYLITLKKACELYCDETAIEMLVDVDKFAYCNLMIQLANEKGLSDDLFTLNFIGGDAKKQIQRRIDNIMKGKKRKFGMAVVLGSFMLSMGLGSTFAYAGAEEVAIESSKQTLVQEDELSFESENFNAEDSHMDAADSDIEIPYEKFFVDKDGNIFPYEESQARAICIHSYVDGTLKAHSKIGTGCKIDYYNAKRCQICRKTVVYDLYSTRTWKTCPH